MIFFRPHDSGDIEGSQFHRFERDPGSSGLIGGDAVENSICGLARGSKGCAASGGVALRPKEACKTASRSQVDPPSGVALLDHSWLISSGILRDAVTHQGKVLLTPRDYAAGVGPHSRDDACDRADPRRQQIAIDLTHGRSIQSTPEANFSRPARAAASAASLPESRCGSP